MAIKNAIEKNSCLRAERAPQQLSDTRIGRLGNSEKMRGIATVIEQVADSDVKVLIRGASGVAGIVRAPFTSGPRGETASSSELPALRPSYREELLGHESGASPARRTTRSQFEQADRPLCSTRLSMKPAIQESAQVMQDAAFKSGIKSGFRWTRSWPRQSRPRADDDQRTSARILLPHQGERADGARAEGAADEIPTLTDSCPVIEEIQPARARSPTSSGVFASTVARNIRELENRSRGRDLKKKDGGREIHAHAAHRAAVVEAGCRWRGGRRGDGALPGAYRSAARVGPGRNRGFHGRRRRPRGGGRSRPWEGAS